MSTFSYHDGELLAEQVRLTEIAQTYGTPAYVYSQGAIESAYRQFDQAFEAQPHMVCYSVKANSNIAILALLARLGSGFDIVSGGELQRVLRAGGSADRIVFSGVGKARWELEMALQAGISCFNVESSAELFLLEEIARELGTVAPISIRVNPDVDAGTHPYIATGLRENKFGVDRDTAFELYRHANQSAQLNVVGIDCHIGSQITDLAPITEAVALILALVDDLAKEGIDVDHIDLGGGLGVRYKDEQPIPVETYAGAILQTMGNHPQTLLFEPGRFIVANAGILLSQVQLLKQTEDKGFAIVDAAMNDLIRPALYQSWQHVSEVTPKGDTSNWHVVGPVCETGDFLAKDRELALQAGDLIAIHSAGAYGFVMSSNYNSRNRAAEVLVNGSQHHCIRRRETIDDQLSLETIPPT
jgi:diaminopimelate decarboxylase